MAGWSFIHAGFLAAGLAVAVPIAIHLLFRQRARIVPIGSIRFLQEVVREHRRRKRLRQWLLLLLRSLAVLLLALLFARPYFDVAGQQALLTELVILLDGSASMEARDASGESSWERAVRAVRELLAETDENVVVHVAVGDSTGVRECPVDRWEEVARTGPAATDYGLAVAWARDVLAVSQRARQRVVLVSDLQRSGLPATVVDTLPEQVDFQLRDVGAALAPNLALTGIEMVRTEIRPGEPLLARAIVRNFGPLAVRQVKLQAEITGPEGSHTVERSCDISGRGTARVELPLEITTDGLYQGAVTLQRDDTLSRDNRRWLAFEARRPDRVLLVDGQEGRSVFANETYYLETALKLRPAVAATTGRSWEVERIVWEAGVGFPRLEGYRAVVVANVRRLSADDARQLREYLERGGSLLVFAGNQVTAETLRPLQAVGVSVGAIADSPRSERSRVSRWDSGHPVLAPFSDPQRGDLRRLEVQQWLPVVELGENVQPLLEIGPAVLAAEQSVGRGRFIYLGTSADRDWTDWPKSRLYVPLIRQLLAYMTDQLAARSRVIERLVETAADEPGVREVDERVIVTNLDPRESSLDRLDPVAFRDALASAPAAPGERAQAAGLRIEPPAGALRADEFWNALAWILVGVLAVELLLASRVHA